jgi:predicted RNA-binding protein with PIN domain
VEPRPPVEPSPPAQPRWLVDGMNVIGSRPDGWWRDRRGAVRALVERLERFAEACGEPVTVVFDGRPVDVGRARRVEVLFAARSGPDAADDDIARLVAERAGPGLRVVTSDSGLAERVRAEGAVVVGAGGFRDRLD